MRRTPKKALRPAAAVSTRLISIPHEQGALSWTEIVATSPRPPALLPPADAMHVTNVGLRTTFIDQARLPCRELQVDLDAVVMPFKEEASNHHQWMLHASSFMEHIETTLATMGIISHIPCMARSLPPHTHPIDAVSGMPALA